MSEAFWIKLYTDTFENPKIAKIRRLPAGNDILLIWIMLLATAGKCNAGGLVRIAEGIPYTVEDLADKFRFKESTVNLALRTFVEYGMIEIFDDGNIYIENWSEYQSEDKLAELRAKDRERKRIKRAEAKALAAGRPLLPEHTHGQSADCPKTVRGTGAESPNLEKKEKEKYKRERENQTQDFENQPEKERKNTHFSTEAEALFSRYSAKNGSLIRITDAQFSNLCEKLSIEMLGQYLAIIESCEKSGKRYTKKSHYQAILDMAIADGKCKKGSDIESDIEKVLERIEDEELKECYRAVVQMRKSIDSPLTAAGLLILIGKVEAMEPNSVALQKQLLETAILHNWKDVYPTREKIPRDQINFDLEEFFEAALYRPNEQDNQ